LAQGYWARVRGIGARPFPILLAPRALPAMSGPAMSDPASSDYDSKLQVFKKMDRMSSELNKMRTSEEQLRAERRALFDKLRAISRGLATHGGSDEALGELARDMAAILSEQGNLNEATGSSAPACAEASSERVRAASKVSAEDELEVPVVPRTPPAGDSAAGPPRCLLSPPKEAAPAAVGASAAQVTDFEKGIEILAPAAAKATEELIEGLANGVVQDLERGVESTSSFAAWAPNAQRCSICSTRFSPFFLRHHCRSCGANVCRKCSPFRVLLLDPLPHPRREGEKEAHRVCVTCHQPTRSSLGASMVATTD